MFLVHLCITTQANHGCDFWMVKYWSWRLLSGLDFNQYLVGLCKRIWYQKGCDPEDKDRKENFTIIKRKRNLKNRQQPWCSINQAKVFRPVVLSFAILHCTKTPFSVTGVCLFCTLPTFFVARFVWFLISGLICLTFLLNYSSCLKLFGLNFLCSFLILMDYWDHIVLELMPYWHGKIKSFTFSCK